MSDGALDHAVVEIEVLAGLAPFVRDELSRTVPSARALDPVDVGEEGEGSSAVVTDATDAVDVTDETAVVVTVDPTDLAALNTLRCAVAAHLVLTFDVARPRSLLSPDHMARLVAGVATARRLHARNAFRSFRISAAGADSDDFTRLQDQIAATTGLARDDDDGDLLLRFRRSHIAPHGWDVLVRLSPRPLSARPWRTFAFPGSLNATVAAAMVSASTPEEADRFLDPMCGSGTLVVERLAIGRPALLAASDVDAAAVAGMAGNLRAARFRGRVERAVADAAALPHRDASFDVVCSNLPWGTSTGSHDENRRLYPRLLGELRRVIADGGRAVLLTHEVTVFEDALAAGDWTLEACHRIFQKGHHPRMYVLHPC